MIPRKSFVGGLDTRAVPRGGHIECRGAAWIGTVSSSTKLLAADNRRVIAGCCEGDDPTLTTRLAIPR
jgi:hypothetical protein